MSLDHQVKYFQQIQQSPVMVQPLPTELRLAGFHVTNRTIRGIIVKVTDDIVTAILATRKQWKTLCSDQEMCDYLFRNQVHAVGVRWFYPGESRGYNVASSREFIRRVASEIFPTYQISASQTAFVNRCLAVGQFAGGFVKPTATAIAALHHIDHERYRKLIADAKKRRQVSIDTNSVNAPGEVTDM